MSVGSMTANLKIIQNLHLDATCPQHLHLVKQRADGRQTPPKVPPSAHLTLQRKLINSKTWGGGVKVCNESNEEREWKRGVLHDCRRMTYKVVGLLPALKAILNEHYSSPWRNPGTADTTVEYIR